MNNTDKPKKKFYKRWWFWLIVVFLLIGISGSTSEKKPDNKKSDKPKVEKRSKENSELKELNNWFENDYSKNINNGTFTDNQVKSNSALKGFKIENGDLVAVVSNNRMKAENLTKKDMTTYALNQVLPMYEGKMPKTDNMNGNIIKPSNVSRINQYIELED